MYRSRAQPVLSYIAQLAHPPKEFLDKDVFAMAKLLRLPPYSFKGEDYRYLKD